jgi:hypothetical protein
MTVITQRSSKPTVPEPSRACPNKSPKPQCDFSVTVGEMRGLHRPLPLPGLAQFFEQGLGLLQVGSVEAIGKPVIDAGELRARLIATAGLD